jgi:hypothetical protein
MSRMRPPEMSCPRGSARVRPSPTHRCWRSGRWRWQRPRCSHSGSDGKGGRGRPDDARVRAACARRKCDRRSQRKTAARTSTRRASQPERSGETVRRKPKVKSPYCVRHGLPQEEPRCAGVYRKETISPSIDKLYRTSAWRWHFGADLGANQ